MFDSLRRRLYRRKTNPRLTGVSLWGVEWDYKPREREAIRRLVVCLEDRRVLYDSLWIEDRDHAYQSIIEIRQQLTSVIGELSVNSPAVSGLRVMRAECRRFLEHRGHADSMAASDFDLGLGQLRGLFGTVIRDLAGFYRIEVEGDLSQIFPPNPADDDGAERFERRYPRAFQVPPPPNLPFDTEDS